MEGFPRTPKEHVPNTEQFGGAEHTKAETYQERKAELRAVIAELARRDAEEVLRTSPLTRLEDLADVEPDIVEPEPIPEPEVEVLPTEENQSALSSFRLRDSELASKKRAHEDAYRAASEDESLGSTGELRARWLESRVAHARHMLDAIEAKQSGTRRRIRPEEARMRERYKKNFVLQDAVFGAVEREQARRADALPPLASKVVGALFARYANDTPSWATVINQP